MHQAMRQYGLFTRHQANRLGLSDDWIWRQTKSGRICREYSNVFRFSVVAPSFHQRVAAACLRVPGQIWASHRSAAVLWALDDVPQDVVEVTAVVDVRPRNKEAIVHRTKTLSRMDATEIIGIPLTTVHRTLIDLGAVVDPAVVEAALESALRRNMTNIARLQRRLEDLKGNGRRGAGVLQEVLGRRAPGAPPTASGLETNFSQLIRRWHLPQPTRQHIVMDESGMVARVDFEYIGRDVVIEVDSREHHLRLAEWENDLRRRKRLTSCGKRVLHVTYLRMKTDEAGIAQEIRRALRATAS